MVVVGEMTNEVSVFTTTTTNAYESLRARGVVAAERVASSATPDLIAAWCEYADRNPAMGPGALVAAIRSGATPSAPARSRRRGEYGQEVRDWLRSQLPDLCPDGEPHPAAISAVMRLHLRYGRGSLTARAHGAVIRASVLAAQREETDQ